MANVIIIRPISESWSGEIYKRALSIPHGPLTLSAHLIDKGYDPLIIDEIALTETIQTEISDIAKNKLKDSLRKEKPICIGISSMTGEQIRRGKMFAKMIREFDEKIPIVWGGAHPSLLPEMTIEIPGVFDTLTGGAAENVRELNLGTVWNEWNNNWSSVDIAGTERTTRARESRGFWPFVRNVDRTTVSTQEVNNRTRTGVRTTPVLALNLRGSEICAAAKRSMQEANTCTKSGVRQMITVVGNRC